MTREGYSADLKLADLSSAKLSNANLSFATLNNVNFFAANLNNASLWKADLRDARLEHAQNLTEEELSGAYLCNTKLPDEFQSLSNRDCEMFKKAEGRRSPTPQSPPQPPSITT